METETVQLLFRPGDRREGYRWSAVYEGKLVGLCRHRFCERCSLQEREHLRGFKGGRLEVLLTLHRRPSLWEESQFYLGHLVKIIPEETKEVDEGMEFDISRLNTIICETPQGAVLIDPGGLGFRERELPLWQFVGDIDIEATLITHGHLDHFAALGEIRTGSVFISKVAFQFASRHAAWQKKGKMIKALSSAKMLTPGEPVFLHDLPLQIETLPFAHSIPESTGLVIKGERARVVHLGDFKFNGFDSLPKAELISRLQEIAREPVDVLAMAIFNAHMPGFTQIEALVVDTLTNIMVEAKARVIITAFSTNLDRIKRVAETAQLLGRSLQFLGAGMRNAQEMLGINGNAGDPEKPVIFVTGCQAEQFSVLWRIANNHNPPLELRSDDTLVFSSRCIPVPESEEGLRALYPQLESRVGRLVVTKGELEHLGLRGLNIEEALTHVSGHARQEDMRLALEILRPKKVLVWPQSSPQIEAFRGIVASLDFPVEIISEDERVIEV